ncbi:competence/damage-inducible protein A [Aceticella autotrophica]|uniref:Putative competence-damage inducible protein n=1 Tax=Aceticella autotrophica TaxID=2755338 RepID=A0A975AUA9_9THEO|nr:competence/damage-inducible protein A [Aceticella autotrophica]QSZ26372.1 competence/damage-inducible protein A [Aceticella autotrophica]
MKSEIISVGTELLLGQIVNTNAKYISLKLSTIGIDVFFQTNVGDNPKRLKECLEIAVKRSDIIILTGGLGPTMDDLTKETVAEFFDLPLIEDTDSKLSIENYFNKSNRKMTANNYKQALFPEGSKILPNEIGTAPGCIFKKNSKIIIILPGPPSELIPMFDNYVYPYLKNMSDKIIVSKVIKIFGIGESKVEDMVNDLLISSNPTVAPLISDGIVTLRITAKSDNKEEAENMIAKIEEKIKDVIGDYIFGSDDETMEYVIFNLLRERNLTLTTAESCTGGLLSKMITDIPGSSEIFKYGFVTYSNEAKHKMLGVSKQTLEKYGAVSIETAKEMAVNAKEIANADYGVSITGIAGPDGGTEKKPVGLVYIGLSYNNEFYVRKTLTMGVRQRIRLISALNAMDMIRRHILKLKIDL